MERKVDFTNIPFQRKGDTVSEQQWKQAIEEKLQTSIDDLFFQTNEQIALKPLYTKKDIEGFDFLDYMPGIPPYLRDRTRQCTSFDRGRFANMQVFLRQKKATPFTAAI